jgi:predicted transposase/invertase (TIGR01784 family)
MLFTEWNWDDALAVRYAEGREEGREEGWEKGREKGREEGWERGRETITRNALAKGLAPEAVSEITGLDLETIKKIAGQ